MREITELFDEVGAEVSMYALDLATEEGVGVNADRRVVLASVFKIAVMLAYAEGVSSGRLDPAERVTVAPEERVPGPTGLSVFTDPVELSLRDLAMQTITVSDNTATDVVLERLGGVARVAEVIEAVGLRETVITSGTREIVGSLMRELGPAVEAAGGELSAVHAEVVDRLTALDPVRTCSSTPLEIVTLLSGIWRDQAAPADACAEVRRVMGLQVWPHRIASGFPDGYEWAGKTGTLPAVRNEAGVVTLPDGSQMALAIFTRARDHQQNRPDIDRAMGLAARLATRWLVSRR
ncbi:serine hydrolase [Nonomuraea sediminis]|uniref:serine hydrolase n=1 Tax=Nonomuraea sediminis TaxID=2835864 RepID=UPI001BDC189C|nr:serine hydrolase [Nonomuraea sediminis]